MVLVARMSPGSTASLSLRSTLSSMASVSVSVSEEEEEGELFTRHALVWLGSK